MLLPLLPVQAPLAAAATAALATACMVLRARVAAPLMQGLAAVEGVSASTACDALTAADH